MHAHRLEGVLSAARGEQSADVLHSRAGSLRHMGHLLHMPAHIFVRLGRCDRLRTLCLASVNLAQQASSSCQSLYVLHVPESIGSEPASMVIRCSKSGRLPEGSGTRSWHELSVHAASRHMHMSYIALLQVS